MVKVISDIHCTNASAFNIIKDVDIINHLSNINNGIHLFFHLLKNIRNDSFNSRRFIFPQFTFNEFYGSINLDAGEIIWKLLRDIWKSWKHLNGSSHRRCSIKKVFLKISQNSQKSIWVSCTGIFLWILWNFYEHIFHGTPLDGYGCSNVAKLSWKKITFLRKKFVWFSKNLFFFPKKVIYLK